MDLIPVKTPGEEEGIIKAMYKSKLAPFYEKPKNWRGAVLPWPFPIRSFLEML
jgi:hypothetical protein